MGAKTITLFMRDGDPSGIIRAEVTNWNGVIYKIPKTMLKGIEKEESELSRHTKQAGIYLLTGEDENGNPAIYIGQAAVRQNNNGLNQRIMEHKYQYERNYAILITNLKDSLEESLSYLEHRFHSIAKEANRYKVNNPKSPHRGSPTDIKKAEIDEFIEFSLIIIKALGINAFEKLSDKRKQSLENENNNKTNVFYYDGKFNAECVMVNDGFILVKGSQINPELAKSASPSTIKLREKYKDKIKNNVTTDDLQFATSSAAGGFVAGSSVSGNRNWKNKEGKSPKEVSDEYLK